MFFYENKAIKEGYSLVCGIDEAGRGPLAGPVVSAAVIMPQGKRIPGVNDSKKLTPLKREILSKEIKKEAIAFAISVVKPYKIDSINILNASLLSMEIALSKLSIKPDFVLIDGKFKIKTQIPQEAIIKGDTLSFSIASASILAKVRRDEIMKQYDAIYPQYEFKRHKGYPTKLHKEKIKMFGISPIHRKSFKGVKEYV